MAKAISKTGGKRATRRTAAKGKPDNLTVWRSVVTQAWKDRALRDRLVQDPNGVLAEHGFKPKKGVRYHVVVDSKDTKHLILPESARSVRVKPVRGSEPDPGF